MERRLNKPAISLWNLYKEAANLQDLNKSITFHERATQMAPENHSKLPQWLNELGVVMNAWYLRLGHINDLVQAISVGEKAVRITPE